MHISCLFRDCIILRCVRFFLIFSLNYQQGLYLYRQLRRDYNIKFTDKSKANLWIHLDLAKVHRLKGLTSPYIISYLHFLNLNNILTLSQTSVVAKAGFDLTRLISPCFLPARFTHMRASLRNQNKCKSSIQEYGNQGSASHITTLYIVGLQQFIHVI